jgi:hypothetical protein
MPKDHVVRQAILLDPEMLPDDLGPDIRMFSCLYYV